MSTREQWLAANDEFLAERLAWLRARLQMLAGDGVQGAAGADAPPAAAELTADTEWPLGWLAGAFNLSSFETNIVFLCVAMELDTGLAGLCAEAQHDPRRDHPSFALAMELFDEPVWDAMAPDRPLRHWPLVSVEGAGPLTAARLWADERIVNFVKGLGHMDGRLAALVREVPAQGPLPLSQAGIATKISGMVRAPAPVHHFALPGPNRVSKELVAGNVSAGFGLTLFTLEACDLPQTIAETAAWGRLWHREVQLSAVALIIDATEVDPGGDTAHAVRQLMGQIGGLVFVAVREPWSRFTGAVVDAAKPTMAEQRLAWLAGPVSVEPALALRMAYTFNFDLPSIQAVLAHPSAGAPVDACGVSTADSVWTAALELSRPALDQLAQRVEVEAKLSQLKLPDADMSVLHQIAGAAAQRGTVYNDYGFAARLRRGSGLSVLFAGESGTGKTMAAEALTHELDLLLYRIDLSAVVSKYIGETEKNLRKLFDAAEDGGVVLFFDEADALFGKRSEVRDSHDRYANIEVSYLLQRIEAFNGLAVLATNRKDSLDQAFLRRLRFVVNFPFPAHTERRAIWREAFPSPAPVGDLDWDRLAKLNLTGGSIHNVALNAAFLAANDGGKVTMPLVLAAARTEFRKIDRPINDADFAWPTRGGL